MQNILKTVSTIRSGDKMAVTIEFLVKTWYRLIIKSIQKLFWEDHLPKKINGELIGIFSGDTIKKTVFARPDFFNRVPAGFWEGDVIFLIGLKHYTIYKILHSLQEFTLFARVYIRYKSLHSLQKLPPSTRLSPDTSSSRRYKLSHPKALVKKMNEIRMKSR